MSKAAKARAVNCTQCGAPLDLHGGHRVRSLNCGFCGAVLDAKEEYKVVKQFKDLHRPLMPLALGMRGKIKGIEFTVIGVVQYRDSEGYGWLEYQIFSPTHGYHWLEFSDGHFVFSHRVREMPNVSGIQKSIFKAKGMVFKVYESYSASVVFVEGELTYVAQIGDSVAITEGICPPYSFTQERSENEEEFLFGEYVEPADVYEAFGVSEPPRPPHKVHAIQPYVPSAFALGVSRVGRIFAVIAVVLAIATFALGGGKSRLNTTFAAQQLVDGAYSEPFTVSGKASLMRLDLESSQNNSWAWYDMTILKEDEPVATLGKQISYYHGSSGGESWSEGSSSERVYFKLDKPGEYRFAIEADGGTGEQGGALVDRPLRFELREDVIVSRYFFVLALLFVCAAILEPLLRRRFEARRWEPVLEDDDE